MLSKARLTLAIAVVLCVAAGLPERAGAQEATAYRTVISANPFGILLEFFNAEFERAVTESSTMGIGGSYGTSDDENDVGAVAESTWFNGDVFWRFYPSGEPFQGWNFGVKAGVTHQDGETFFGEDESGTNFGIGFDANHSWLLGRNNNFYVGVGFGLKRLFGNVPDGGLEVIPTFRIVNVGFAF